MQQALVRGRADGKQDFESIEKAVVELFPEKIPKPKRERESGEVDISPRTGII